MTVHRAFAAAGVLAGLSLTACGAHRTYQGSLPESSVATVKGSRSSTGVRIYFVVYNSQGERKIVYTLEVPNGPQKVVVYFATPDGETSDHGVPLEFYADGGHTYQVKGARYDRGVWLWIEDTATHEVVGGRKPD